MARYFFDIRDTTGMYPDEEGLELADQKSAEVEATRTLGENRQRGRVDGRSHRCCD